MLFLSSTDPQHTLWYRDWLTNLGEDVVVNDSGVDGECAHQGDEIPSAEEDLPDLAADVLGLQLTLAETHPEAESEDDEAVAGVT